MFNQGVMARLKGYAQDLNAVQSILLLFCSYFAYHVLLVFYRITLHPLARFPGPKLAGATYWYEYYYDVSKRGRYIWKIIDLHQQYGPVVRVNPNEIHFNDPDFYDEIYHGKKYKTDRHRWYNIDHIGQGLAFTTDHDVHLRRRNALAPYFSMQSIRALEPRITDVVEKMMGRIREAHKTGAVLNLYHMFSAFALDIVSEYAFGTQLSTNLMAHPDMGKWWAELISGSIEMNNFGRQFKGFVAFMMMLPDPVMKAMNPMLGRFLDWKAGLGKQMKQLLDERSNGKPSSGQSKTVLNDLIDSDLPPQDKTLRRLTDEAQMMLGAGGETTAASLNRLFYHLLTNPPIVQRLRSELRTALPEAGTMPTLAELQGLPYLNAVVEEGIRRAFPVPARSPRVFHDHILQYGQWTIKPGMAVSMSPWMVSMNENVFPEPLKFDPERWLGNKELRKYQVTFSKGKRVCLGINLAYAEVLFAVARIVRNFDFELFETPWEEVEIAHDFFVALPKLDAKGVRVKVNAELS